MLALYQPITVISDRLIIALDLPDLASALSLCDRLPMVTHYKVGLELFISEGAKIIYSLRERQKQVFLDLKLHDIPNTVARACQMAVRYEVKFLTIHAIGGQAMLSAAQEAVAGSSTQLLAVTLLTSLSARELAYDLKVPLELPEYVQHLAQMADRAGIKGLVCSPQEVAQLRTLLGKNTTIVCPGVRPLGTLADDQNRTMTPAQALQQGADYLVIGRPITQAPDPAQAWSEICQALPPI
jgi:orotidine-5'-phosphate decarboxylase